MPTDATEFSYWVTHNLPLDNNQRDSLLKMDCPVQRLRKQLEIMQKVYYLHPKLTMIDTVVIQKIAYIYCCCMEAIYL